MATYESILKKINLNLKLHSILNSNIEKALSQGQWVKLICGASNQDLPSIADLCAVYGIAGVHCIDVSADAAVVNAAKESLDWVEARTGNRPWLMISLSDGKDAHFRKAWFDPKSCPKDCPRPCQKICPAKAIPSAGGIHSSKCYGCGRCIDTCPMGLINEKDRRLKLEDFAPLMSELRPDAIEIHTAPGRSKAFQKTIKELLSVNLSLKRIAVSCGIQGYGITHEKLAQELWERFECLKAYGQKPIWQLDGRRMSGDLGYGAARVSVKLWKQMKSIAPPGPLQLAGGTNGETIKHLPGKNGPSGVAFGGMARKIIQPWLIESQKRQISLREWPEGWNNALEEAKKLVNPWLERTC
tara:strand:- start:1192 stop:2259 length:1068 start_codon:yes stop_codon:yes gene_type:complete